MLLEMWLVEFLYLRLEEQYQMKNSKYIFGHGIKYVLPNKKVLIGSYHPSPRNVNTGRIDINKMTSLFKKIKKII